MEMAITFKINYNLGCESTHHTQKQWVGRKWFQWPCRNPSTVYVCSGKVLQGGEGRGGSGPWGR